MPPENEVRQKHEKLLLEKLYDMAVLSSTSKLSSVEHNVTVSAFARRRLPVVSEYWCILSAFFWVERKR